MLRTVLDGIGRRSLDIDPPRWREALQLNLALWLTVMFVIAVAAVFAGQVRSVADGITVVTGAATSLLIASMHPCILRRLNGRPLAYAAPALILALVGIAILQTAADYGGQYAVDLIATDHRMPDTSPQSLMLVGTIYWLLGSCNMALLLISGSARRIRNGETALARSEIAALRTELKMLRMQLNPHFLANSLNALSALIAEGRNAEAEAMAQHLADFLHATVHLDDADIRVEDEFRILQHYIDMEMMRFGARLHTELTVEPELRDFAIPNFLLQPLVENAFRHGVEHVPGRAEVRVVARRDDAALVLIVENEGLSPPMTSVLPRDRRSGIGLANTRSRLRMLFGGEAALVTQTLHNGYRASIRLPLSLLASHGPGASITC